MATFLGIVTKLQLDRENGEVVLRQELQQPVFKTLHLYADTDVNMIDPTEMVRRNWMIGLLQQAVAHGLVVSIEYSAGFVKKVTLLTHYGLGYVKSTVKGTVLQLELLPMKGSVTIRVPNPKYVPLPTPGGPPATYDYHYYIYSNLGDEWEGLIESAHRDRVIRLLQQALADGLNVTLETRHVYDGYIVGVILHRKE